jgi:hypothetical protein
MPSLTSLPSSDNLFYVTADKASPKHKKLIIVRRPLRLSRSRGRSFLADRFALSHGYLVNSTARAGRVEKEAAKEKSPRPCGPCG